jgi:hypothetical protein
MASPVAKDKGGRPSISATMHYGPRRAAGREDEEGRIEDKGPLGFLFLRHEPGVLGLRENLRVFFGLKSEDGLVAIDGHNDRVYCCPCRRILSRRYFNVERHPPGVRPAGNGRRRRTCNFVGRRGRIRLRLQLGTRVLRNVGEIGRQGWRPNGRRLGPGLRCCVVSIGHGVRPRKRKANTARGAVVPDEAL